jgi:hypothetical protein
MTSKKALHKKINNLDKYQDRQQEEIGDIWQEFYLLLDYLGLDIDDASKRVVKVKKGKK